MATASEGAVDEEVERATQGAAEGIVDVEGVRAKMVEMLKEK